MQRSRSYLATAVCSAISLFSLFAYGEEYEINPSQSVLTELHGRQGGSPDDYQQAREALKQYETVNDFVEKKVEKNDSFFLSAEKLRVPVEIEVTREYVSSLNFVDVDGQPWPIRLSRVGNNESFSVSVADSNGESAVINEDNIDIAHMVSISTGKSAGRSNLKVYFKGINKEVQIPLVIREKSYHNSVTIMLPFSNPEPVNQKKKKVDLDELVHVMDDPYARNLIDGLSASQMVDAAEATVELMDFVGRKIIGAETRAISVGDLVYLKASLSGVSPAPTGITRGMHGYSVFRFEKSPRLVSGTNRDGKTVLVKISKSDRYIGLRDLPLGDQPL